MISEAVVVSALWSLLSASHMLNFQFTQVRAKGWDDVAVPEHDVLTRRAQFRMKSEKKAEKKVRKEARKVEKAKRLAEGPRKRGRPRKNAAETGQPAKKQRSAEPAEGEAEIPNTKASKPKKKGAEVAGAGAVPLKVRGKKGLARLKRLSSAQKLSLEKDGPSARSSRNIEKTGCSEVKAEALDTEGSGGQGTPASRTTKKSKPDGAAVVPPGEEAPPAEESKEDVKVAKPSSKKAKNTNAGDGIPDRTYVELVKSTLKECEASDCTHPSFQWGSFDKSTLELTTYWSRGCCGVKLDRKYTPAKGENRASQKVKATKSQKKRQPTKAQVAYFSCPTPCTYSNVVLANIYAPRRHYLYTWAIYIRLCAS